MTIKMTDEEMAQQLQEQYRQEFLLRQQQSGHPLATTAPLPPPMMAPSAPAQLEDEDNVEIVLQRGSKRSKKRSSGYRATATAPVPLEGATSPSSLESDEALARRIQRELEQEDGARATSAPPTRSSKRSSSRVIPEAVAADDDDSRMAQQIHEEEVARQMKRLGRLQQRTESNVSNPSDFYDEKSDDAMEAQRIAQEMDDAEMAHRLTASYQKQALDHRTAAGQVQRREGNRFLCRFFWIFVFAGLITVVVCVSLGVFTINDIPIFGDIWPTDGAWVDSDPFGGRANGTIPVATTNAARWSSGRDGLQLTILDAVSEPWKDFVKTAVQDWDKGAPVDSLTLNIVERNYEKDCRGESGFMKICNGDYGDTEWRGLNEVLMNRRNNEIIQSSAKLNEYYLNRESDEQKLYTVCHEIGHGFGLPHWDEDFANRDLGNCMDYTNNPEDNMRPDASNFDYLAQLYGGVTAVASSSLVDPSMDVTVAAEDHPKKKKDVTRRILHEDEHFRVEEEDQGDGTVLISHYLLAHDAE